MMTYEAARQGAEATPEFSEVLANFDRITLPQMGGVALLKRIDTKYVLSAPDALDTLECLAGDYRALEVAGTRIQRYRTQYFDTSRLELYLRHHAGNAVRYKVRSRAYLDPGISFLEVKRKSNKDWTTKYRTRTQDLLLQLNPDARAFLAEHLPISGSVLQPSLWNEFLRITLVSKRYPERLTLDLDVRFGRDGLAVGMPGVAIVELKQDGINRRSDFVRAVRERGLHPSGISKYCVGVSLLYDSVKHNNFKPKLRLIEKAAGGRGVWRCC